MRRRLGRRTTASGRDESGLITLEWLLIVAAALVVSATAVAVVQNYIDSAAQNAGSDAHLPAAAAAAASRITADARGALPSAADPIAVAALNETFGTKCDRLEIAYFDFAISASWTDAEAADHAGIFNLPNPPARALCTVATSP